LVVLVWKGKVFSLNVYTNYGFLATSKPQKEFIKSSYCHSSMAMNRWYYWYTTQP